MISYFIFLINKELRISSYPDSVTVDNLVMSGVAINASTVPGYAYTPDAKPNNGGYSPALPIETECRCNAVKLMDLRHVNAGWKSLMRSAYQTLIRANLPV